MLTYGVDGPAPTPYGRKNRGRFGRDYESQCRRLVGSTAATPMCARRSAHSRPKMLAVERRPLWLQWDWIVNDRVVRASVCLFVTLVFGGCLGGGTYDEVYVTNDGDQEWLIRTPLAGEDYPGAYWVSRISPGADGSGSRWAKRPAPNASIEILALDCSPVAKVHPTGRDPYHVLEAPGLTVTITPWGSSMSRWNTPEIQFVESCGGVLFH